MSEFISADEFHQHPGVDDWRVTGLGATLVLSATSLEHAATIVASVVDASNRFGVQADIDLRPEAAIVRIPDLPDGVPASAPAFAAAVSVEAARLDLVPDPARAQSVGIYVAQHSEADARPFFAAALGYEPFGEGDAIDPLRIGPRLAFNPIVPDVPGRGRTHFDVFVPAEQVQARIEAAVAAGGRLVDDSNAPIFWTLASPDNHGVDIAGWTDGIR